MCLTIPACAYFGPPSGSAEASTGSGSCRDLAVIDNFDDGDDRIMVQQGRGGYIYTYMDETGSTIAPSTNSFTVTNGGATDDGFAMRMTGKVANGGDVYAGMGFSFMEPAGKYDASIYRGLAFIAKRGPDSVSSVKLKVPDANTDPQGAVCVDCYNDFGVGFKLTEEWTRYEVDFADLKQEQGWGDPNPAALDVANLFGIQFQVATAGAEFDIWIDEITFIGCPD